MTTLTPLTQLVTIDEYAATQRVSTKTVKRWLAADEIPGAEKIGGRWAIPADATRIQRLKPPTQAGTIETVGTWPGHGPTVSEQLDQLPAYVPAGVAADLLGISETYLRRHPAAFGAIPAGKHGALVIPAATIRQAAGS